MPECKKRNGSLITRVFNCVRFRLQIGFDKIDEMKNRLIEIRLTLKKHNNETMNAQDKIKRVKSQLQKEREYLKKLNDEEATLKEHSLILQKEEEKAKKQAQETESKLQDAQNEFKRREELKLSMINSTVQVTGYNLRPTRLAH